MVDPTNDDTTRLLTELAAWSTQAASLRAVAVDIEKGFVPLLIRALQAAGVERLAIAGALGKSEGRVDQLVAMGKAMETGRAPRPPGVWCDGPACPPPADWNPVQASAARLGLDPHA